jgi:hypothetical protein
MTSKSLPPKQPIEDIRDGCPVLLVPLPCGGYALCDPEDHAGLADLEFSPRWSERSNGRGARYIHLHALLPRDIGGRWPTQEVARLIVARRMVLEERRTGKRIQGRFRVGYRNGDHRDLRFSNLVLLPARNRRGSFRATWDVRERLKVREAGESPVAVFRARKGRT